MTYRSDPPAPRRRWRTLPLAAVVVALLAASGLAGCQALSALEFYSMGQALGPDFSDPCMSARPSFVAFSHGTATISFSSGALPRHVALTDANGTLADASQRLECGPGSDVSFTSEDGRWELFVMLETHDGSSTTADASISFEGDSESGLWADGCVATLTEADAKGIVGTASCKNATWRDDNDERPAPSSSFGGTFNATIAFEARP